jgi:hypothetical protein
VLRAGRASKVWPLARTVSSLSTRSAQGQPTHETIRRQWPRVLVACGQMSRRGVRLMRDAGAVSAASAGEAGEPRDLAQGCARRGAIATSLPSFLPSPALSPERLGRKTAGCLGQSRGFDAGSMAGLPFTHAETREAAMAARAIERHLVGWHVSVPSSPHDA